MAIYIFYHIYCNSLTLNILKNQIEKIHFSGLYDRVDAIYCFFAGINEYLNICKDYTILCGNKFKISSYCYDDKTYERFTLYKIREYIQPDDKFLYIHTKGITVTDSTQQTFVENWRTLMEYFLLKKHVECIKLLDNHDTVGVNYRDSPEFHYSGNFWWTKGSYFLKLPIEIGDKYLDPEMYITKANPNYYNLHSSDIDHYYSLYTFNNFVDL